MSTTRKPPADLTVAQLTSEGSFTGDGGGRMTTRSHTRADNWHITVTTRTGAPFIATPRSIDATSGIDGLDRARAATPEGNVQNAP